MCMSLHSSMSCTAYLKGLSPVLKGGDLDSCVHLISMVNVSYFHLITFTHPLPHTPTLRLSRKTCLASLQKRGRYGSLLLRYQRARHPRASIPMRLWPSTCHHTSCQISWQYLRRYTSVWVVCLIWDHDSILLVLQ